MKKSFILFLLFALLTALTAQDKKLTVEDVVNNSYGKLRPTSLLRFSWIPETNSYSYLAKDYKSLLSSSSDSKEITTIVTLDELNKVIKGFVEKELKYIPGIKWINEETFKFRSGNSFLTYNLNSKKCALLNKINDKAANLDAAPNNKYIAYTIENNLFVSTENGKEKQITSDVNKGILNGQAVHQREFGITKGIFWSPKSSKIAFYKMDESMVTDYPILEINQRPLTVRKIKYPMAGDPSHHVSVGLYDIKSDKTVFLQTDEDKEHYYTCITWGPEEKFIYVTHLNRDQNHSKLVKYDAVTGNKLQVLFEEKDPQFVEPEEDLIFLPNTSDEFLVFSERTGYKHLYHYSTDGELIKQITDGDWVVTSFNGFTNDGESIIITATKETPVERHIYKVDIESGKTNKLTSTSAYHRANVNSDEDLIVDSFNSMEIPQITNIINLDGDRIKNINEAKNPLAEYKIGETKILKIKAADKKTDLYCRLTLPPNFDKTKKYPAIVYVYGGPHSQDVVNVWPIGRYKIWDLMMAQKGYVVFYVDNRGTDNRGLDFEQATHRKLGTEEVADQLEGVNYLINTGYVDKDRIGCWGWSYGGFMTTSMITRSDAFKVGVAGGAVIDWNLYEIMYTERYMDRPQDNPEGFEKANLLSYVENLKNKKLLLVHGTSDPVVLWQHTLRYAKKAASLNVPLDYFPYIQHGHGVRGKDGLQLYYKITNYFLDNL